MAKEEKQIFFCVACGKTHAKTEFYVSENPFHANGRLPICKKKMRDYVASSPTEISPKKLQSLLRQMDLPYIHSVYVSAVEDERETLGTYFAHINSLRQYKGMTWDDSEFEDLTTTGSMIPVDSDFYVSKEITKRWGLGYEETEYQFLESYYHNYVSRLEKETPAEISLVNHICRAELNAFKASQEGSTKEYGDAVKVVTELMKQLNLSPNQQKDVSESEEAFGVFIKRIENEEPIDEWDDENDFAKDIMGTFKFMMGHIAKMIGKPNPFEGEYDDIMRKYSATPHVVDEDGE